MVERLFFHEKLPVLGTLIFSGFSPVCGDFEKFQKISVCGLCTVMCGDFEKFQRAPVVCGV